VKVHEKDETVQGISHCGGKSHKSSEKIQKSRGIFGGILGRTSV
jgi:hypothetical protein